MGDRVIKSLALFLKQRLRKTDHIGRYGGEEFAVVMPSTDAESAKRVLDDIRQRFAEIQYSAQPHGLSCTFSGGIGWPRTWMATARNRPTRRCMWPSTVGATRSRSIRATEPQISGYRRRVRVSAR